MVEMMDTIPDPQDQNNAKLDFFEGSGPRPEAAQTIPPGESLGGGPAKTAPEANTPLKLQSPDQVKQAADKARRRDYLDIQRVKSLLARLSSKPPEAEKPIATKEDERPVVNNKPNTDTDHEPHRGSRRIVLKGALGGLGLAVAKQTGVLEKVGHVTGIGDAWEEAGREVERQEAAERSAKATEEAYAPTREAKERADATATKEAQEQEQKRLAEERQNEEKALKPDIEAGWDLLKALQSKDGMNLTKAMRLMPSALKAHDAEGVYKTLTEVKAFVDYPNSDSTVTLAAAVADTRTPLDKAESVWRYVDNEVISNNDYRSEIVTSMILRNHVEGEQAMRELSDRRENLRAAFDGLYDDSILFSLVCARDSKGQYTFSVDQIKSTVDGIKGFTIQQYSSDVADLLAAFQLTSGIKAESMMDDIGKMKEQFPELNGVSATQMAIAKKLSGDKQFQADVMYEGYLKKMDAAGEKRNGPLAASLTFMAVVNNPELNTFDQLVTSSGGNMGLWYNTFYNPISPFSGGLYIHD